MKRLVMCILILVMCSVAYGSKTIIITKWLRLQNKYEIMARESYFRYNEIEKFYEYQIEVTEYKDKLLSDYGYKR